MTRALFLILLLLLFSPAADSQTFPSCASIGQPAGCLGNTMGQNLLDDSINIRYFGAKGDGVTDDTAAIQATIDYAANNKFQTIFCPSGNYLTSSPLYLDPPGNLRSNLSSPSQFAFSMSFVGQGQAPGNHEGNSPGCRIKPNFNNKVAFYVGPGQRMRVANLSIVGASSSYRANQNSSGVCLGTTGGAGGSSANLIENVWCENFYTAFQTQANGGCCVNDNNRWSRVFATNAYYAINIVGGQTDINVIDQSHLEATVAVFNGTARQVTIIGGDAGAGSAQHGHFTISGTSALTVASDPTYPNINDISFTTTVTSPDIYFGNVYTAFTINTSHFGVIPLVQTNWNSGTDVITLQILPGWIGAHYGNINLKTATDLQAEIQAVTTLYATELTKVFWGAGFHAMGVHIENPAACTTLLQAGEGSSGDFFSKLDNLFFNYIISHTPAVDGSSNEIFYCQQTFPFIVQERGANQVEINGGNFLQDHGYALDGVVIDSGDNSEQATINFRNLNMSLWAPNLRFYGSNSTILTVATGDFFTPYADIKSQGHGFATWDQTPFFSHNAAGAAMHSIEAVGEFSGPYCGYRPCPWTTPSLPPGLYSSVSGTLGALGSYPLINCETIYRSVAWNATALTHLYLRSASCPMMSYGQNLDDSTVNASHGSFTGVISNGAGGSGTQLAVTGLTGSLGLNDEITGTGVAVGEYITACPGGGCNTNGTYTVSTAANIASEAMKSFATQVTWLYKGQTNVVYLDAKTLSWMRSGLAIEIPDPVSGNDTYIVTGVYPTLGYVTIIYANSDAGTVGLVGTKTTVFSKTTQASIFQNAYSFTAY